MRYLGITLALALLGSGVVIAAGGLENQPVPVVDSGAAADPATAPPRVYPIAPGVWYPGDGPLPEKPMRYYRVRCWPGCHTGSALGKYPDAALRDKPIWPTSTVPGHGKTPRR